MTDNLLLKFREKNTGFGVTRKKLKEIANHLDVSETMAVHMALARFHRDLFDNDEDFDFPSDEQLRKIDRSGEDFGEVVKKSSIEDLF